MMFHVKLRPASSTAKGIAAILLLFLLLACVSTRSPIQISDYLLLPNGIEVDGEHLTAFVFENNKRASSIESFLNQKLKTDNYSDRKFDVTINKDKYRIFLYENSEFDKYFGATNFAVINLEPQNAQSGSARDFIAISMVDSDNRDCLSDDSLFHNIATKYLKSLKDEYIANGTR